jgi:regulator of sigma E protease
MPLFCIGDRIVWADGVTIYSLQQLSHILNDAKALLTIQRGQDVFLRRVPRIHVEELKLNPEVKEELIDWQFEAQLNGTKIQKLYYLPYNLNNEGIVEGSIKFIDQDKEEEVFSKHPFSSLEQPLEEGDRIIAVDGISITRSYEILSHLQQHYVNIIVERDPKLARIASWQHADALFDQQYKWEDLHHLVSRIGIALTPQSSGNLVLLNPVVPKMRKDFQLSSESQARLKKRCESKHVKSKILMILKSVLKRVIYWKIEISNFYWDYLPFKMKRFNIILILLLYLIRCLKKFGIPLRRFSQAHSIQNG